MIDKKIFLEEIKTFLIAFNFEFFNEDDLKIYIKLCYDLFGNLDQNFFIKKIQEIIKNNKNSSFCKRPSPNDFLELLKEKEEKKEDWANDDYINLFLKAKFGSGMWSDLDEVVAIKYYGSIQKLLETIREKNIEELKNFKIDFCEKLKKEKGLKC